MVILLNILIAALMTWFTQEVYSGISNSGFITILLFIAWNTVLWLLTFFYNKKVYYRIPIIGTLILFYLKELFVASLRVA